MLSLQLVTTFFHFLARETAFMINDDSNHMLRYNANKWHFSISLSLIPKGKMKMEKTNDFPKMKRNDE
jgi:hypothetical protein